MLLPDPSGHRDVALGLCRAGGRLLLVRNLRSVRGVPAPLWDLPGGTVEPGESLAEALAREWREEVGWTPRVGDLRLVVDGCKRPAPDAPALYTWRAFVLEVEPPAPGVEPAPGEEVDRAEFVEASEAVARLAAPYHDPLRRHLAGDPARHAVVEWVEPADEPAPAFDAGLRRLLVLAAAAAVGDGRLVALESSALLAAGAPAATVEEVLLQVVPYAGFPRALAALAAARPVLGPPAARESEAASSAWADAGARAFDGVYGDTAPRVRRGLASLHPLLSAWTQEFAYGRVLARPALSLETRELLAVSILAALGRADDALLGHMRAAVRLGASPEAVAGAVAVVPTSAGPGRRAAARALLSRL